VSALKVARRDLEELRRRIRDQAARAFAAAAAAMSTSAAGDRSVDENQAALRNLGRGISDVASVVAQLEPLRAKLPGTAARIKELIPGAAVIVTGIGRGQSRGVVDELPQDGKVTIRMGSLRASVAVTDVLMDSHRAARRAAEQSRRDQSLDKPDGVPPVVLIDGATDGRATLRTAETTIDVRGQRMDEAVAAVDRFVDEGMMGAREILFVVHGHGTGVLRSAIRTHLASHKGVKSVRAGAAEEGGDGVTVMFL
jgi:DNA mismatch repair protein MutS2